MVNDLAPTSDIPSKKVDSRKMKVMTEIFNKPVDDVYLDFDELKNNYLEYIKNNVSNLESYM